MRGSGREAAAPLSRGGSNQRAHYTTMGHLSRSLPLHQNVPPLLPEKLFPPPMRCPPPYSHPLPALPLFPPSQSQVVLRSAIVDASNSSYTYGSLYAWKSFSDTLYVTVSLNATGFGPPSSPPGGQLPGSSSPPGGGQLLYASPSLLDPSTSGPSGRLFLWDIPPPTAADEGNASFPAAATAALPAAYLSSEMLFWPPGGLWSCFTFAINLVHVCNPLTSTYSRGKVKGMGLRTQGLGFVCHQLSSTCSSCKAGFSAWCGDSWPIGRLPCS